MSSQPGVRIRAFGPVEVTGGTNTSALHAQPKRLALLLYLAVARPHGFHRRDRLVNLFWPEHSQASARAALRKAAYALRQFVDTALVSRGDEELGLDPNVVWCDASQFDATLEQDRLAQALELYRGDLMVGFFADAPEFERWMESERDRYRADAAAAAWALAERYEHGRDLTQATRWARRAAQLSSTDERAIRRTMQLLRRAGDRAGAIRVYEEFASHLRQDLSIEPSFETRDLARQIREDQTGLT